MNDLFLAVSPLTFMRTPDLIDLVLTLAVRRIEMTNSMCSVHSGEGPNPRAVAMKVSEADRYVVNSMEKERISRGRVGHSIDQHLRRYHVGEQLLS
jgi:hypothetical protein